jgi:peptide deformylase
MKKVILAVLLALFVSQFWACAHYKPAPVRTLHPTEKYLAMSKTSDQPMLLVENDSLAGDDFLRIASLEVDPADDSLEHLTARMLATLLAQKGVGIAAPQVGINRRLILVKRLDVEPDKPIIAYLNPKIIDYSKETIIDWEGCLSIPAGFGQVERAKSIVIRYQDSQGLSQEEKVEGFTARIFQHEIDHLDGILFIDRKKKAALIPKEEYKKLKAEGKLPDK